MMRIDARLPIRFGSFESRRAGEAVLRDEDLPGAPSHMPDCACCSPRSAAAQALAALFRQRAVGPEPAFKGVLAVVSAPAEAAIRTALAEDVLVAARYRLDPSQH